MNCGNHISNLCIFVGILVSVAGAMLQTVCSVGVCLCVR